MKNKTALLKAVRNLARNKYAWPGGYPMLLVMADGDCLCADCTKENYKLISKSTRNSYDDWTAAGVIIHWEGAAETCRNCHITIESAYGESDYAQ